jgi:heat-inducible transcriptional repressor
MAVRDRAARPTTIPEGDLDPRKAAILTAVVNEYIASAQPVGSQHVAAAPGVNVSSATVRAEMVALEGEGYLAQPHTSAGRIPTDKGYRFFVDHLTRPGMLDAARRRQVRDFFDHAHGEIEDMLERTSGLLADLTDCTAMVVGPAHGPAPFRSVQLVALGPRVALAVVVLADGTVEKQQFEFSDDVADATLAAASQHLQGELRDHSLDTIPPAVGPTGDPAVDAVAGAGLQAIRSLGTAEAGDQLYVGGSSRMAAAFDAVDTVRSVLSILEQQLVVVSLLRDVLDRGLSVAIGTEHGFEPLASCAIVVVPVSVEGGASGTVGLLGPTRMNYPQALAAVQVVGEQLGARLGEVARS